ncbi:NTP transferase domain-containing protein [Herbaspirillum sp. RV1423]|uniref:nucleotidyltransferase family protein n=1 Tax=Herbaspirillum sp. RV1423 TaxID=1443993 RepID=UPI0004BCD592|nr:nucleotidyltransferase family protein [Herbaspirillum sp. RV1423]
MTATTSFVQTPFRGLLLAAGRGTRFDPAGTGNKLLARLPDSGEIVAVAAARSMLQVLPVLAVVNAIDSEVARCLAAAGCDVVECADAAAGMSASLMCGIRHAQEAAGWIIALCDMPYVQPSTHAGLLAALKDGVHIAVPTCEGKRGNPVGFGRSHLEGLLGLSGDRGARGLLQDFPVNEVPVNDPGIHRDIDTRADLAAR